MGPPLSLDGSMRPRAFLDLRQIHIDIKLFMCIHTHIYIYIYMCIFYIKLLNLIYIFRQKTFDSSWILWSTQLVTTTLCRACQAPHPP